jgi:hypothetical protein
VFVGILLALNLVGLTMYGVNAWRHAREAQAKRLAAQKGNAASLVSMGLFTQSDGMRLFAMSDDFSSGGQMSTDDLGWWVGQLSRTDMAYDKAAFRRFYLCLGILGGVKSLGQAERETLVEALRREMSLDQPGYELGFDKVGPANVIARLGDKTLAPIVQPLLSDKRPAVRFAARKALDQLGIKKK